jgi:hypothetical protein
VSAAGGSVGCGVCGDGGGGGGGSGRPPRAAARGRPPLRAPRGAAAGAPALKPPAPRRRHPPSTDAQQSGVAQETVKAAARTASMSVQEAQMILGVGEQAPWAEVMKVRAARGGEGGEAAGQQLGQPLAAQARVGSRAAVPR